MEFTVDLGCLYASAIRFGERLSIKDLSLLTLALVVLMFMQTVVVVGLKNYIGVPWYGK